MTAVVLRQGGNRHHLKLCLSEQAKNQLSLSFYLRATKMDRDIISVDEAPNAEGDTFPNKFLGLLGKGNNKSVDVIKNLTETWVECKWSYLRHGYYFSDGIAKSRRVAKTVASVIWELF